MITRANFPDNTIFVFGSNLAGRHGAGAARYALSLGAVTGIGCGRAGMTYAIPTKDCMIQTLPKTVVALYIAQFIRYARTTYQFAPHETFRVTRIGCGLAGFKDREIAPFFSDATPNCQFDEAWRPWLGDLHRYWGTYP